MSFSLTAPEAPAAPSLPFFFAAMILSQSRSRAAPLTQNTAFPAGVHDGRSEDPAIPVSTGRLRLRGRRVEEILGTAAPRRLRAVSRRSQAAVGLACLPSRRVFESDRRRIEAEIARSNGRQQVGCGRRDLPRGR